VHERDLRSCRFNRGAKMRDILHRFATERSPEVTQKDQKKRRTIRQRPDVRRNGHAVATAELAHFSSFRASS
jgi:hypothetical protein